VTQQLLPLSWNRPVRIGGCSFAELGREAAVMEMIRRNPALRDQLYARLDHETST